MMTNERAQDILGRVQFPGYAFRIVGDFARSAYLQAVFDAPCSEQGSTTTQTTRKWLLSRYMTPSELVQTAFKCVLTSIEHEAREQFTYKGAAIFGPHFDVERLVLLCGTSDALEVRS